MLKTRSFKRQAAMLLLTLFSSTALASCSRGATPSAEAGTTNVASTESGGQAGNQCAPELTELEFGIISTESQSNQKPKWEPFIAALSEGIGRDVKASYATDYAAVIEAMGAGKVHMAWYGGKSYIEAAKRSEAEAFAQTVNSDGTKGYYAYLITNKNNPILADIDVEAGDGDQYVIDNAANLTFAFNDPNSTSGFLVPSYYVFAKNDVNPDEVFKELIFAGSHEATALAVANNQVDVATNNSESMVEVEKNDPTAFGNIQVIWTSPEIPSDPIAYRKDLPDCLKAEIQDFFYTYSDEAVLGPLEWQGFDSADDTTWNTVRELEISKSILETTNDATLDEATKQQKLDELNKELEAVQ
ncbi:MAG: phosphonate ABC transporter, periplasmic phosphonate binding protein [Phormidesmis priestleyi Ana]|uniref:Phosphonate ABC transporter, periplasmic phosphonate binding protein n=1 Tax=Phormidesmis priestleyi Ana TaxID=1666911 RepID=A0A0P8BTQ4_9CYAN|nr:MAG: phosphonate ABC transporter, periplasmic phosphonate binding protein [Phormidesmis priestleyi Ana]